MRLALFLPSLAGGGAERVMVNLARGFAERGFLVDLVLCKAEGPYLAQVPPEVRIVDLNAARVLASVPGLVRYLRRERPKALLSALFHANVAALWAQRLSRVPVRVVVSVHGTLGRAAANAPSLRARLMPVWVRMFYSWAYAVVAVSQGAAEDLVRTTGLPREKVSVIYNPVVTPELLARAEEPLEHPWFAPGGAPVVLAVGRLTAAKDFPTLLRAFAIVRRDMNARLMILGEGEDRPKLEEIVKQLGLEQDVALPGFAANPFQYMRRAAVFALSSEWEGLPSVIVEALAVGIPVIATDCPNGPREILENGKWGILVPVGDHEALARELTGALGNPVERKPFARAEDYGFKAIVSRYLEVFGLQNTVQSLR